MFKMDRLGQGTWHFGENRKLYEAEIESIRYGIQNGVTLIDTAEMYGDGKSESLIGEAIKDFDRSRLYIVSKILPWNAGYDDFFISLSNSLKKIEYILFGYVLIALERRDSIGRNHKMYGRSKETRSYQRLGCL